MDDVLLTIDADTKRKAREEMKTHNKYFSKGPSSPRINSDISLLYELVVNCKNITPWNAQRLQSTYNWLKE
jgi:hypothetical protein